SRLDCGRERHRQGHHADRLPARVRLPRPIRGRCERPMNTEEQTVEQVWTHAQSGPFRVLVVEDEELMRAIIAQLLRREGYEIFEANTADAALQTFEREKIDLAVLDLNLSGGGSGLDLLGQMHELDAEVMGVIVTAYASIESAVEA